VESLEERIAAADQSLGNMEREVARFFAERRDEVPFMSAVDIASALDTSNATVIRTAQALGYAGLLELKKELATALRASSRPAARLGRSLEELEGGSTRLVENVIEFDLRVLEDALGTLDQASFEAAIHHLHAADRISVLGTGYYKWIAHHFVMCLVRYGRRAYALTEQGPALAEELIGVSRGDAIVAIGYEKPSRELIVTLEHAKSVGVPTILITDVLQAALRDRFTVALAVGRGDTTVQPTAVGTMMVIEALMLGLAAEDPERVFSLMPRLNALRDLLS
jgi:DNA-binding MurR/RpiR family transcriptional regulator